MSSESRMFGHLCPVPLVGVTGSSGKTTTATLIAEMLGAAGVGVTLGGNIGEPLLTRLRSIERDSVVVIELSSFQLAFWGNTLDAEPHGDLECPLFPDHARSPDVAVVLNITPNHLDRHPSMDDYIAAKAKIFAHQRARDSAVLSWDDATVRDLAAQTSARVSFFSMQAPVPEGAYLRDGELVVRKCGQEAVVCARERVGLRGRHNVANVLAACATCAALDVGPEAMAAVATSFAGVEHRLELVGTVAGVAYYNDSIATSPERSIAALESFSEPIVLLAGGRDKHLPWETWADVVTQRARNVILFGEAAPLIERALHGLERQAPPHRRVTTLDEAVAWAYKVARPGDVVLLSPGGTSFDAFRDFAERGRWFKQLVRELG